MSTIVRSGVAAVLLILSAACGNADPASPGDQIPVVPPSNFPPLSGPSRTFVFGADLEYAVVDGTKLSRFVLYDNGAFVLKFVVPALEYRGGYSETNGTIAFSWEGWSRAGSWSANGTLKGDSLTIRYNDIMLLTDFEDALYVRQR